MKNKPTEPKSKSTVSVSHRLFSGAMCLGAVVLICANAPAENLFVAGLDASGNSAILEFTPNGVESTFASGLSGPLAFDNAGNLFVTELPAIYKFTPVGARTTFASGLNGVGGLVFDRAGNLFVADSTGGLGGSINGTIYKFSPDGMQSTFAIGLSFPGPLAFDHAGNLFVVNDFNTILKFTPTGVRTTFASIGPFSITSLACDRAGNIFASYYGNGVADADGTGNGVIYKFTSAAVRRTFASGLHGPVALAFDRAGNLFVQDTSTTDSTETKFFPGAIYRFTPSGGRSIFAPGFDAGSDLAFQPTQTSTPPPPNTVATPSISPDGGRFGKRVMVTMTDATPGASIYYTLDGTDPTTVSTLYLNPFTLTRSATVKAIAVDSNFNHSGIATATFRIRRR
jgi:hypothetical protein